MNSYFQRGLCQHRKGNYDAAIADYSQGLKLAPSDAELFYNRGLSQELEGNRRLASDLLALYLIDADGKNPVQLTTDPLADDFPAFYDSVNGLFVKLAEAIDGRDAKWVKAAAAAPDIDKQINDTRELFKLCK